MNKCFLIPIILFSFLVSGCDSVVEKLPTEYSMIDITKEYKITFLCNNCKSYTSIMMPKGTYAIGRIVECPVCGCDTEIRDVVK